MTFRGIMKRVMKCLYRCVPIFLGFLFSFLFGVGGGYFHFFVFALGLNKCCMVAGTLALIFTLP